MSPRIAERQRRDFTVTIGNSVYHF